MGLSWFVHREREFRRNPWKRYLGPRPKTDAVTVAIHEPRLITIVPAADMVVDLRSSPPRIQILKRSPDADLRLEELNRRAAEWSVRGG